MATLQAGARFGPYRLIRPLGRGGFAEVWEAESLATGRQVALKILTELRAESERGLERFRQEGRLAASLSHPRCVYVFDAGAVGDLPFISMELVPGGTLQDRLRDGPLPTAQAVDRVLEVLDGLEAAHQIGIIHRDVKPSNVFLDADGRAKIGDFGISKSLESDSSLSVTGAFLGTPFYASPEQLAGDTLDFRSDLYSVGVMLYELLTGALPFGGAQASHVLAQVLTREPTPFARHAARVPERLQRVVLRLLAKQQEKRYQSYQALRDALVPFASRGLSPAELARRLGAIVLDFAILSPIPLLSLRGLTFLATQAGLNFILLLPDVAYYTLTDRFLGGSLGKRLLGLRVTSAAGPAPGLGRVALRSLVFVLVYHGALLVLSWVPAVGVASAGRFGAPLTLLAILLGIGLITCTMRRANGYAGLHELVSGTRVVAVQRRARRVPVPQAAPEPMSEGAGVTGSYGPYRPVGVVWRAGGEAFLVARDDELRRDVWVHTFGDLGAAPIPERLRARGSGSLPWLQRGGGAGAWWDAYGAPTGIGMTRWVVERGRLGWEEMRDVLGALARELEARFTREGAAGSLSLANLWIDGTGRAVVLDFPAAADPPGGAEPVTPERWQSFVRRVAVFGLEGEDPGPGAAARGPPRVPLPAYARPFVGRLAGEGTRFATPHEVAEALDVVAHRPARVTRARRLGSLLTAGVPQALLLVFSLIVPVMLSNTPRWFRDLSIDRSMYLTVLRQTTAVPPTDTGIVTARHTVDAITIVLAAAAAEARRVPRLGRQALAQMPDSDRAVVESAAQRYPAPTPDQIEGARAWLDGRIPTVAMGSQMMWNEPLGSVLLMALNMLGAVGVLAVPLALLLRGPLLLHLFGIGVQRIDGAPAARWRCALRSLIAWSPLLLLMVLPKSAPVALQLVLAAITLGGVVLSALSPERGLADRLMGTVLVPK